MPTIRVDEEVYGWLQSKARPFEDTPNSVLRRIAGLAGPESVSALIDPHRLQASKEGRGRLGLDGKQLNEEWNVWARHALFSRDGTWYENLERFPGALFDAHGYVLFHSEEEYRSNPRIRVGKKTNVQGGIAAIPGYVRKSEGAVTYQDRASGAAGDSFGSETAPHIAKTIGATMVGPDSNEATYQSERVVIKCAGPRTTSVGVTFSMLERLQKVIAAFQQDDGSFAVFALPASVFKNEMRETRSQGRSAGKVGLVSKRVFAAQGQYLGSARI